MKHNEANVILDNVLSENEIAQIYSIIENPIQKRLPNQFAQVVSDFNLPGMIAQKIISYSEKISGESGLEISEYQFARYQNVNEPNSGEQILPNLIPHWDASFEEPRFTFDYQIGGNTTWPLVVEDKEFVLQNNTALTFSGTHQIHWRVPKSFQENEYLDMVFFHLRKINAKPYDSELPNIMQQKQMQYELQYKEESK
jgi:hypothetical protein